MTPHAAPHPDPPFRFNATPPDWMIGLVILFAIAVRLTSEIIIDLLQLLFP